MPKAGPAFGRLCLFCKEKNHYAKMCPQKNPPVHMADSSKHATSGGQVQSEELFIETLTGPRSAENSAWFSILLVGGTTVKFKLDTGAEVNVLPLSVYYKLWNIRRVETLPQSPLTKSEIKYKGVLRCALWVGRMEGEYHIELDNKLEPVVHPPRRVPYSLLERLKLKPLKS